MSSNNEDLRFKNNQAGEEVTLDNLRDIHAYIESGDTNGKLLLKI